MDCNFKDICDCEAMPTSLCRIKQIVEYCLKERENRPTTEIGGCIQTGKDIITTNILDILGCR